MQETPHSLVLFWLRQREGGSMPKFGERGGLTFRVSVQPAPGSAQTFFRMTQARDSIDARVGERASKYNPSKTVALTWGYYWMKNAKNSCDLELRRLLTGNEVDTHLYAREACRHVIERETPVLVLWIKIWFYSFFSQTLLVFSQNRIKIFRTISLTSTTFYH